MKENRTIILGAGPAGLAAGYRLAQAGSPVIVLEKESRVGGLSKTYNYKDCYFDIGGHRFYTRIDEVMRLWFELLEDKFKLSPRLSRIFYKGKLFNYPIKPLNSLLKLGIPESLMIILSFARVRLFPYRQVNTFEEWVSQQFGRRLYRIFFKTYSEKIWGVPCDKVSAEWAAQRIKGLSLKSLVKSGFTRSRSGNIRTLIQEFHYPELGPGMMYETMKDKIKEMAGEVLTDNNVIEVAHDNRKVILVRVQIKGKIKVLEGTDFLSSVPITELLEKLNPPSPPEVKKAAESLSFRSHLAVNLFLDQKDVFPDNWLYIHSPGLRMGRIQNYKNWSSRMVYNPDITTLGVEYFCNEDDELWKTDDERLIKLAKRELGLTKLANVNKVFDGFVARSANAYPVYKIGYKSELEKIRSYLERFENLQCIGRAGQYQYNNMDHSILSGLLAAQNIIEPERKQDVWHTKIEGKYIEY